jgi:hypothetical protein
MKSACVSSVDGGNTDPSSISLRPDETVTCTFTNTVQRGSILITKTRKHAAAADTGGDPTKDPHEGVTFTVTGGSVDPQNPKDGTTDSNGQICIDGLILSSLTSAYSVKETLPDFYKADGNLTKSVSVTQEGTCDDGIDNEAKVSFANTPLTDLKVSVDSLVDGGTRATIKCEMGSTTLTPAVSSPQDDPTNTVEDLLPGTYVCTVEIGVKFDP